MADLNFKIQQQSKDQWCWAAVASSICGFYQDATVPTQCSLANQFLFASEDCCLPGASESCNIPFALDIVLNQLGHLVQPPQGVVSFEDLNAEIAGGHPVVVRIMFSDLVTAHFVVIVGCAIDHAEVQMLKIADPTEAAGNICNIGYSALMDDFRPGAIWDQTYFTSKET
jgi:hypothetical protein